MSVPEKSSWVWRNILNCRSKAAEFIKYIPGNDSGFLLWHDPWINSKPLLHQFDASIISALNSQSLATIGSIQNDGVWVLGVSNYQPVRDLRTFCDNISIRGFDRLVWDNGGGRIVNISAIYHSIRSRCIPPLWLPFVWSKFRVAKFALISWLIMRERLLTKDRMQNFSMNVCQVCVLCGQPMKLTSIFSATVFTQGLFLMRAP
ncbi:uncharacterized protein LOC135149452 [Daucus carota subsp. sativus]|uniref:uncharacterized protein LOC135149451 n=1 Tax=Daucus carota subsp. sativus TaxID=79200 RepID=UPI003083CF5C